MTSKNLNLITVTKDLISESYRQWWEFQKSNTIWKITEKVKFSSKFQLKCFKIGDISSKWKAKEISLIPF